jgi:hypothetical protein
LRRLHFLPRLYLPLTTLLCLVYAWRPIGGGFDFWAHAAVGRWIANHMQVPRQTLFLWSASSEWVAHSWLSELFFYILMQAGESLRRGWGTYVVVIFTALIITATFLLLWRLWMRHGQLNILAPVLFALAIWCSAPRFQPRQEIFSALFIVLLLAYLIAWSEERFGQWQTVSRSDDVPDSLAFALVPLFLLWVNLHALVLVGLALLAVTVICDALQDGFDARVRLLAVVAVLCAIATCINPYGPDYWSAADQLRPGNMAQYIEEWKSPLYSDALVPVMGFYVIAEFILVAAAFGAWRLNPQRRWSNAAWLLVMSYLFLRQRRHLWLLAIVSLAVLAANARYLDTQAMWTWWRRKTKQPQMPEIPAGLRAIAQMGVVFCLALWIATAALTKWRDLWPPRAVGRDVPEGAVRTIQTRDLHGRMFNDYENSSYLQWRLNGPLQSGPNRGRVLTNGQRPLYIDLLNAYPDGETGLMVEYLDAVFKPGRAAQVLERRRINYVVLGAHRRKSPMVQYLMGQGKTVWTHIYKGADADIWVRRNAAANDMLRPQRTNKRRVS